jgi:hypothetical protein
MLGNLVMLKVPGAGAVNFAVVVDFIVNVERTLKLSCSSAVYL